MIDSVEGWGESVSGSLAPASSGWIVGNLVLVVEVHLEAVYHSLVAPSPSSAAAVRAGASDPPTISPHPSTLSTMLYHPVVSGSAAAPHSSHTTLSPTRSNVLLYVVRIHLHTMPLLVLVEVSRVDSAVRLLSLFTHILLPLALAAR